MRAGVSTAFFFLVLAFMTYESGRLFAPFFGPLLMSALLAIVFYPLHEWLGRKLKFRRPTAQALFSDLVVFLFFLVPLALLIWAAVAQVETLIPALKPVTQRVVAAVRTSSYDRLPFVKRLPPFVLERISVHSVEIEDRLQGLASESFSWFAAAGTAIARNTVKIVFGLFIVVFSLFFFFRDGPGWYRQWNALLPLSEPAKKRIDERMHSTVVGVVRGTFITALAQSAVATIGFFIVKLKAALFLGFVTFAATLIPSVGTALIWVPVAIYLFIAGSVGKGIFMVLWGILAIGLIDNVVRPLVVGNKADMPFFWLFFAILGGLDAFGIKGLILGPLILGLMPVLLDIYRSRYTERRRTKEANGH